MVDIVDKLKNGTMVEKGVIICVGCVGMLFIFAMLGALIGDGESSSTSNTPISASVPATTVSTPEPIAPVSTPVPATTVSKPEPTAPVSTSKPTLKPDKTTLGEKNALNKALDYLAFTHFSYSGLVKQLEFEGYTNKEAEYGADQCGADWNKQAALKAQDYLDFTHFSYSGLVKQLEFEGYTNKEAEYGADQCGADWNEQAALKAQDYLDYSSFSRDGLIDQLEFEGFTHKQAEYGVQAVGY